ncbi:MAG: hypothetical protein HYZ36_02770 [Pedosphaera parvula]|nr:hypothetical protein [Pedosphaera parvula]
MDIPSGWAWLWWTLAALAVIALLVWLWRWWQRRQAQRSVEPAIPPHIRARKKLTAALDLIEDPKPFCTLVSDIIRVYLEERFTLLAPERTTEEFLQELQSSPLLTADQKQTLGEFLATCDLVKFARVEPLQPELQSLHNIACRLVEETEPGAGPAPGATLAESAPMKTETEPTPTAKA